MIEVLNSMNYYKGYGHKMHVFGLRV